LRERPRALHLPHLPARVVDARLRRDGDRIILDSKTLGVSSKVIFVSKTSLVAEDSGDELSFTVGPDGTVEALRFGDTPLARKS